jgi:hypothetical protein
MSTPAPSLLFRAFESSYTIYESLSWDNAKTYASHTYAKILTYSSQLKEGCLHAYQRVIQIWYDFTTKIQQIGNTVKTYAQNKRDEFVKTEFWIKTGQPFYKYNIKPLRKIDYALLGGSSGLAGVVVIATWKVWVAMRPIICLGGALAIIGAFHLSRRHVQAHFKEEAWEIVDNMRSIAYWKITYTDRDKSQPFKDLITHRNKLNEIKVGYLEEQQKEVHKQLESFNQISLHQQLPKQRFDKAKNGFIESLKGIQGQLAFYKPLADPPKALP